MNFTEHDRQENDKDDSSGNLSSSKSLDLSLGEPRLSTWNTYGGNVLWIPVLALAGFGILFVYSASSVYSLQNYGTEFYFARKQALFLVPSFLAAILGAKISLDLFYRYIRPLFCFFVLLTAATHLPHVGRKVGGASRWFAVGPLSIQPSEFLKVFSILFFVKILVSRFSGENGFSADMSLAKARNRQFFLDLFLLFLAPVAIIAQKDLGTTLVVISAWMAILFINGLPKRYFAALFGLLLSGLTLAIVLEPYRITRVLTFLNPFKDPLGAGFQVIQSFVAVAHGGLLGKGIGESQQKLFFLPEAHTDFILAVITEEMGFVGILVLAILYCVLYYAILRLVIYARTQADRLLATGTFAALVVTTIINMGVVAGALPTKGLPLPFISNGGSALIANFFLVGLMAQISRRIYSTTQPETRQSSFAGKD